MSGSLKISVIVPAYNEEAVLEQCLRALESQTVKPYEVIVVDNNSTDKTAEIARRFDVRLVTEKKQGIIHTRARGFDEARGDIIGSLDADSVPRKDWVERIQRAFEEDDELLGLGGCAGATEVPTGSSFPEAILFQPLVRRADAHRYGLEMHNILYGHNMAVRRTAWLEARPSLYIGPDGVETIEDIELSAKLSLMGKVRTDTKLRVKIHMKRSLKLEKSKLYWKLGKNSVARHYKNTSE